MQGVGFSVAQPIPRKVVIGIYLMIVFYRVVIYEVHRVHLAVLRLRSGGWSTLRTTALTSTGTSRSAVRSTQSRSSWGSNKSCENNFRWGIS